MIAEGVRRAVAAAVGATGIVAGLAVASILPAAAAPAGSPVAGYWWLPEPVAGLIPVPGVSADGLYVASSPTGPQAEAAVRFPVAVPGTDVRLTLHVSTQERLGNGTILGYPATSTWRAGGPQPWSARPSYRSSARPVTGVFGVNHTTLTLTFPAPVAARGIVLVPAGGTFTIAFTPPSVRDIAVLRPSTPPTRPPSHSPTPHHSATPHRGPPHHPTSLTPSAATSAAPTKHPEPSHRAGPAPSDVSPSPTTSVIPTTNTSHGHTTRDLVIVVIVLVGVALLVAIRRFARRAPHDDPH